MASCEFRHGRKSFCENESLPLLPVALQTLEFFLQRLLPLWQGHDKLSVVFHLVVVFDEPGALASGLLRGFDFPAQNAHRTLFTLIKLIRANRIAHLAKRDSDVCIIL